jgi:uncharacterized hydrophobic protein (TIGR00271 family)
MVNDIRDSSFIGAGLSEDERREVLEDLFVFGKENQRPFFNRMAILLLISTVIACCGLLSNSAAVVIGAMLIAPMMRPVMSASGAIVMGWSSRLYASLLLVIVMAVAAVLISMGITTLAPDMVDIPMQIMDRTRPTFFDLIIALASGAAGAYTMTRKESSAIPGVAMAVSLLPPLSSCGILLVFGEDELALRALILFVTNFFAMIFAATVVFILTGVSPASQRRESAKFIGTLLFIILLLIAGVSIPLYFYSRMIWCDDRYEAAKSEILQNWLKKHDLQLEKIRIDEENNVLYLSLTGPQPPLSMEGLHTGIRENLLKEDLDVDFKIQANWTRSAQISWPPPADSELKPADVIRAKMDKLKLLKGKKWAWRRTQYSGEVWSGTDNVQDYTITFGDKDKLRVKISCRELKANYSVSEGSLNMAVKHSILGDCAGNTLDNMFINDLNRVVDYRVEDDNLVLELGGDAGAMFFSTTNSTKP